MIKYVKPEENAMSGVKLFGTLIGVIIVISTWLGRWFPNAKY